MTQTVEDRRSEAVARIDRPHARTAATVEDRESPAPVTISAAAGEPTQEAGEQIRNQAAQLAGHLRDRLRDLDQREAHLNARFAQLESDLRTSRMLLAEKENTFLEREAELEQQLAELQQRIRVLSADEVTAEATRREQAEELVRRATQLEKREQKSAEDQARIISEAEELRARREELLEQEEKAKQARETAARERQQQVAELDRQRRLLETLQRDIQQQQNEDLQQREMRLTESEASLADQIRQVEIERAELADQRRLFEQNRTEEDARLAEKRQRMQSDWQHVSAALHTRRENLDRRETALEKLHEDTERAQREILESRLVVEELWTQLCEKGPGLELTRVLSQLRAKLAEHFRMDRVELEEERDAGIKLAERLQTQQQALKRRRAELENWLQLRESALEQQATQIVAREREIDDRQQGLGEKQEQWQNERWELQRQIRQLQAELRHATRSQKVASSG